MKCVCGYEKLGYQFYKKEDETVYYKSGAKKGQVKEVIKGREVYEDVDPDKREFIKVTVEKSFSFMRKMENSWGGHDESEVEIFACPECGTLKIEV